MGCGLRDGHNAPSTTLDLGLTVLTHNYLHGQYVFPCSIKRSSPLYMRDQVVKAKNLSESNFDPGRECQYSRYSSDHPLTNNSDRPGYTTGTFSTTRQEVQFYR